jgi:hypothetical protein
MVLPHLAGGARMQSQRAQDVDLRRGASPRRLLLR